MAGARASNPATPAAAALDAAPGAAPASAWRSGEAALLRNDLLPGKRHHYAVVELPGSWTAPRAGQFFMLGPAGGPERFALRRPMSVARAWREGGALRLGFLYTVIGSGTKALAAARERWHVLGPLGRPFVCEPGLQPILVAGGRGVAPLVLLAEECAARGQAVSFLNGARNATELVAPADLDANPLAAGSLYRETTEDGSRGRAGRVLDWLSDAGVGAAADTSGAVFYSCGPHGLLEAVGLEARHRSRPAQVALEAHMACGTGICRSCVVPRAAGCPLPEGASNPRYILACLDGPVVDPATVDWRNTP